MAYPSNWPQNITGLANRIMGKIGSNSRFTNITTDTTDNGILLRETLYDTIRETQSAFIWPELEKLSTITTPDATFDNSGMEYPYSYRYSLPDDYLRPINEDLYDYVIKGSYVYSDVSSNLDFHYVGYNEDVKDWSASLYRAVVYRTAIEVCLQIAQAPELKQSLLSEYKQIVEPECFRVSSYSMRVPNTRKRMSGTFSQTRRGYL